MSLDRSLKLADTLIRHRNVLSRAERIQKLKEEEKWDESKSVFGLPKVAHRKATVAGKPAAKEQPAAVEGAAPAEGAPAAAAVAAAGKAAAAPAPAPGKAPAAAPAAAPAKPGAKAKK